MEVAIDFALQCSPDHPWVKEHPEWFTIRADGSIAYAENPPKKYQDIYPLNFDKDSEGIYDEIMRVVRHWMAHGVRIFRVDNPHTKPVAFWERLLADIHATDPDVLFLAEAFTRPAMMRDAGQGRLPPVLHLLHLANTKQELEEYLTELSHATSHYMRPNFFVNTPDILHEYLQHGGVPAFHIRAVLAATDCRRPGASTPATSLRERPGATGQRRVPRSREIPVQTPRLGSGRARRPQPRPAHHRNSIVSTSAPRAPGVA